MEHCLWNRVRKISAGHNCGFTGSFTNEWPVQENGGFGKRGEERLTGRKNQYYSNLSRQYSKVVGVCVKVYKDNIHIINRKSFDEQTLEGVRL